MTMELIAHTEVGAGGASSISLASIPATYDDLQLILNLKTSYTSYYELCDLRFNGSTSTTMHYIDFYQQGTSVTWSRSSGVTYMRFQAGSTYGDGTFSTASIYLSQYLRSAYKQIGIDNGWVSNSTSFYTVQTLAGLWYSNTAISSIQITPIYNNFVQYSSATLYGIKKA